MRSALRPALILSLLLAALPVRAAPDPEPAPGPLPVSAAAVAGQPGAAFPYLGSGAAPAVPVELASAGAAMAALGRADMTTPPLPRPDSVTARAAAAGTAGEQRCTADGALCIRAAHYVPDVCAAIEVSAGRAGLDPHFLARLLWQESLFEPGARSPVGAQGIAQFMPGTAAMVGLDDPWNPAKAIRAAADYLRGLRDGFGNLGLAAIAYNGGEARAASFVAGAGGLPWETRAYVAAITGHDALTWRDAPPASLDLRLDADKPFREACTTLAAARRIEGFATPPRMRAWGVIIASHPDRGMAQGYASQLQRKLAPLLGGQPVEVVRKRLTGSARAVYTAQVGYDSRAGADGFCMKLRRAGGRCIVLRN